jgi:hypothetical protein
MEGSCGKNIRLHVSSVSSGKGGSFCFFNVYLWVDWLQKAATFVLKQKKAREILVFYIKSLINPTTDNCIWKIFLEIKSKLSIVLEECKDNL